MSHHKNNHDKASYGVNIFYTPRMVFALLNSLSSTYHYIKYYS